MSLRDAVEKVFRGPTLDSEADARLTAESKALFELIYPMPTPSELLAEMARFGSDRYVSRKPARSQLLEEREAVKCEFMRHLGEVIGQNGATSVTAEAVMTSFIDSQILNPS